MRSKEHLDLRWRRLLCDPSRASTGCDTPYLSIYLSVSVLKGEGGAAEKSQQEQPQEQPQQQQQQQQQQRRRQQERRL